MTETWPLVRLCTWKLIGQPLISSPLHETVSYNCRTHRSGITIDVIIIMIIVVVVVVKLIDRVAG